jgi:DNA (cytosine-5)-methyltransferase 1
MSGGGRSHLHPFIARTLSVRECARLQTFDDDYLFEGTISRQFTQVGNAVPPLLAEQIARHIQLTEFGLKLSTPLHHGSYLQHNANLTELVAQLLAESRQQKPEWIYLDTVDSLVLSMS